MEILKALADVLADPKQCHALQAIVAANPVRISMSPDHSGEAIWIDNRAGTREHGQLDAKGNFAPIVKK